jgi:hypothetical protein
VATLACASAEEEVVVVVVPLLVLAAVLAEVVLVVVEFVVVVSVAVELAAAGVAEEVDPESLPPQPANAIVTLPNNAGQAIRPVRVTFIMRPRKK